MKTKAVLDIGNTSLKMGIITGKRMARTASCEFSGLTAVKLRDLLRIIIPETIDGAVACSVAPANAEVVMKAWKASGLPPLILITHKMKMPIRIKYPLPATIGTDRLAAASASWIRLRQAHIVIDVGTAVTLDCVDSQGRFTGGVIAPGPMVMTDYLANKAEQLPLISFSGKVPVVGKSTEGAMRIGVAVGYSSMVNGIIDHLVQGVFRGSPPPVMITGGLERSVKNPGGASFCRVRNLTLEGLGHIYELNS